MNKNKKMTLEFVTIERPSGDFWYFRDMQIDSLSMIGEKDKGWKTTIDFVQVERSRWWRFKQWLKRTI